MERQKTVMKEITHGACNYLLKPARIEELWNIWQHVVWSVELYRKFISALNHLGIDKAVPKRILMLRNSLGKMLQVVYRLATLL